MEAIQKSLSLCQGLKERFVNLEARLGEIRLHPVRWRTIQEMLIEIDRQLSIIEETVRRGSRHP